MNANPTLRGDYTKAAADYSVEQHWSGRRAGPHSRRAVLHAPRQPALPAHGVAAVDDPRPRRRPFALQRILRTEYRIDRYQDRYFAIDSFAQLMRDTAPDFAPLYARLRELPALDPSAQ